MTAITVTADHIAKGARHSYDGCPVARAMQRAFPRATAIQVSRNYADISHGVQYAAVRLPQVASEFICAFDADLPVKPFSFDLAYPPVTA